MPTVSKRDLRTKRFLECASQCTGPYVMSCHQGKFSDCKCDRLIHPRLPYPSLIIQSLAPSIMILWPSARALVYRYAESVLQREGPNTASYRTYTKRGTQSICYCPYVCVEKINKQNFLQKNIMKTSISCLSRKLLLYTNCEENIKAYFLKKMKTSMLFLVTKLLCCMKSDLVGNN